MTMIDLSPAISLPEDGAAGTLVGRAWLPGEGPAVVVVQEDGVFDVSRAAPTCAGLLERAGPRGNRRRRAARPPHWRHRRFSPTAPPTDAT